MADFVKRDEWDAPTPIPTLGEVTLPDLACTVCLVETPVGTRVVLQGDAQLCVPCALDEGLLVVAYEWHRTNGEQGA